MGNLFSRFFQGKTNKVTNDGESLLHSLWQRGVISESDFTFYRDNFSSSDLYERLKKDGLINSHGSIIASTPVAKGGIDYSSDEQTNNSYTSYDNDTDDSPNYFDMSENQIKTEQDNRFYGTPDWYEKSQIEKEEFGLPWYARSGSDESQDDNEDSYNNYDNSDDNDDSYDDDSDDDSDNNDDY